MPKTKKAVKTKKVGEWTITLNDSWDYKKGCKVICNRLGNWKGTTTVNFSVKHYDHIKLFFKELNQLVKKYKNLSVVI